MSEFATGYYADYQPWKAFRVSDGIKNLQNNFDKYDTNKNGKLDLCEIQKIRDNYKVSYEDESNKPYMSKEKNIFKFYEAMSDEEIFKSLSGANPYKKDSLLGMLADDTSYNNPGITQSDLSSIMNSHILDNNDYGPGTMDKAENPTTMKSFLSNIAKIIKSQPQNQ